MATPSPFMHTDLRDAVAGYDPITFAVILNRFNTIVREMTLALEYSAWTTILAVARDFSCAIYDSQARQVCMLDGLPVHTNSLHVVLKEIAQSFTGDINDGDVILCNDPHLGNTHVADLVTACPVFVGGQHLFWSVTKGHQLDCGAYLPTSIAVTAKDVWQEGLTIPPLKLYDRGKRRDDVFRLYLANVRWKDWLKGDLQAQLGSIWTARRRLVEMIEHYGVAEIQRYTESMLDYADRRMAEEIRAMPKGVYHGETWVDSDGQGNTHLVIRTAVTIKDETIEIDFSGSAPPSKGAANASYGVLQAAAGIPILCCIDPDIPHNEGCLKHIVSTAPKGTICHAEYPAATAAATILPGDAMQDAVWKALAEAMPERVAAGYARMNCSPSFAGIDRRDGRHQPWGAMFFNGAGGGGASAKIDGWPLIMTQAGMGGLKILSVEMSELYHPVLIEHMEVEPDSMGHGRHIGGPGIRLSVRPIDAPMDCHLFGDGQENPPHAVAGGTPAIGGGNYKENLVSGSRTYYSTNGNLTITEAERWVGVSSGGGGYGLPSLRSAEQVASDVRDGLYSRDRARDTYGVVLSESLEIDWTATRTQRQYQTRHENPAVVPNAPAAATWRAANMRPGDSYALDPQ
ncbi:MAG: hydantoinase B/oxoprolinase family protein [Gammaproteobacteria bacterium]